MNLILLKVYGNGYTEDKPSFRCSFGVVSMDCVRSSIHVCVGFYPLELVWQRGKTTTLTESTPVYYVTTLLVWVHTACYAPNFVSLVTIVT